MIELIVVFVSIHIWLSRFNNVSEIFKKSLFVWDNSAQASRALKSALPLLTKVGTTGIFCDFHDSDEYDIVALEEVTSWLECHGITVTTVNNDLGHGQ